MTLRIVAAVAAVAIVAAYAIGSGRFVATSQSWYLSLQSPAWQPPDAVFGLAWSYNFVALAIVGVAMALWAPGASVLGYLAAFAVSVGCGVLWAYLFYGPHALVAAAIALTLCAAITVVMVAMAFSQQAWLGWLLVPYQLWLAIATSLSWGYWLLNRNG